MATVKPSDLSAPGGGSLRVDLEAILAMAEPAVATPPRTIHRGHRGRALALVAGGFAAAGVLSVMVIHQQGGGSAARTDRRPVSSARMMPPPTSDVRALPPAPAAPQAEVVVHDVVEAPPEVLPEPASPARTPARTADRTRAADGPNPDRIRGLVNRALASSRGSSPAVSGARGSNGPPRLEVQAFAALMAEGAADPAQPSSADEAGAATTDARRPTPPEPADARRRQALDLIRSLRRQ